ncbi:hypothetical protein TNCV_2048241, partial [Trichonephila clavipes]
SGEISSSFIECHETVEEIDVHLKQKDCSTVASRACNLLPSNPSPVRVLKIDGTLFWSIFRNTLGGFRRR